MRRFKCTGTNQYAGMEGPSGIKRDTRWMKRDYEKMEWRYIRVCK